MGHEREIGPKSGTARRHINESVAGSDNADTRALERNSRELSCPNLARGDGKGARYSRGPLGFGQRGGVLARWAAGGLSGRRQDGAVVGYRAERDRSHY